MTDTRNRTSTGKLIALVVVVAIITGVVSTLVQQLVLGHSNPGVTGGVVGAVTALLIVGTMRKKSG